MILSRLCLTLVLGALPVGIAAEEMQIELMIVTEGDVLRGLSYSAAAGPHVATVGIVTATGVATGAIASQDPVEAMTTDDGFILYTSPVGQTQE